MEKNNTILSHLTSRNVRYSALKLAEENIKKSLVEQGFFNFLKQMNNLDTEPVRRQAIAQRRLEISRRLEAQRQSNPNAIPSISRLMGRSVRKFGKDGIAMTILSGLLSGRGLKGGIGDLASGAVRTYRKARLDRDRFIEIAKKRAAATISTPTPPPLTPAEKARQEGEARRAAQQAARAASVNRGVVPRPRGETSGFDVLESKKYSVKYLKSKYYK